MDTPVVRISSCVVTTLLALSSVAESQTAPMTVIIRYGDLNTDCYPSCSHPTEWLQQLTAEVRDSSGTVMSTTGMWFDWGVDFCAGNSLQYNFATGYGLDALAVDGNLIKIVSDCCPTCAQQTYRIGLRVWDNDVTVTAPLIVVPNIPRSHAILQNYPNPFNARTRIPFELSERSHVRLDVVDIRGRIVAHLADRDFAPGRHAIEWTPDDVASGIYLARLNVSSHGRPPIDMTVKMVHGK